MEADKKKKMIMMGGAVVLFLGLVYFLLGDKLSFRKAPAEGNNVTTVLPEADVAELSDSKIDIYTNRTQKERDTESYFAGLGKDAGNDDSDISLISDSVKADPSKLNGMSTKDAMASLFPETSESEQTPATKPAAPKKASSGGGTGARSSASGSPSASGKKSKSVADMTADEKMEFDRQRAQMMRDVLIGKEAATGGDGSSVASGDDVADHITISAASGSGQTGIISSLDDAPSAATDDVGEDRPVKCIFVRDEKIKTGQRVTIRILEDLVVDGVTIPANSHLSATCTIGDRLSMRVTSIEQRGKIYGMSLDAYDIDGGLGIYCPETGTTRNNNTIKNNAVTAATSTLGGVVGRVAGTVVNTGAALVRNSSGDVTVSITSGYEFYLMKTKKR